MDDIRQHLKFRPQDRAILKHDAHIFTQRLRSWMQRDHHQAGADGQKRHGLPCQKLGAVALNGGKRLDSWHGAETMRDDDDLVGLRELVEYLGPASVSWQRFLDAVDTSRGAG